MAPLEIPHFDVVGLRAENPGPLTLTGTNTWIVGRDPAWVVDPGPSLAAHLDAVSAEVGARGGLGGVALTHGHRDHSEAVAALLSRFAADGPQQGPGPLETLALPGHSPDHVVYLLAGGAGGPLAFTGDAVLGQGSVFVAPDPGALSAYLAGLRALRARSPALIAPGHGPLVEDPEAKLAEYLEHRAGRERRLLGALEAGHRSIEALLDAAWADVPAALRPAAALTLAAHLDKLEEEGRLPAGVQRPAWPIDLGGMQP